MLVKREQHLGPTVYSVDRIDKEVVLDAYNDSKGDSSRIPRLHVDVTTPRWC